MLSFYLRIPIADNFMEPCVSHRCTHIAVPVDAGNVRVCWSIEPTTIIFALGWVGRGQGAAGEVIATWRDGISHTNNRCAQESDRFTISIDRLGLRVDAGVLARIGRLNSGAATVPVPTRVVSLIVDQTSAAEARNGVYGFSPRSVPDRNRICESFTSACPLSYSPY